ncbi:MAG: GNAT family N-acetyltransferase [Candidatus Hermodarchaeota archaeon]|nr:GNAT family N-acetyltransferase [Candidatus Hermodarchaeota archaeon]
MCSSYTSTALSPNDMPLLADLLGDSSETVLAVHALRRQNCQAYIVGELPRIQAALLQISSFPSEPQAFGTNANAILTMLQTIHGWDCVNVAYEVAESVGALIQKKMKVAIRYYGDFYYTLSKPVMHFRHKYVRRLRLEDLSLLESAPKEFQGHGYGTPRGLLEDGVVACGIVSGKIVSIVHTAGHTKRFADIGVITREDWRNKGLASAAASIVAEVLQEKEITPVWSAGDDNLPSVRIAQKLGFSKVSQRQYVILEKG